MADTTVYEPAYPVDVDAGSTETNNSAWNKYVAEIKRVYKIISENIGEGAVAGLVERITALEKSEATLKENVTALEESEAALDEKVASLEKNATTFEERLSALELKVADSIIYHNGVIIIWNDTVDTIPTGWQLCDGTNGTPDLRDKFVEGAGGNHVSGDVLNAGLPNITGSFGAQDDSIVSAKGTWSGALYQGESVAAEDGVSGDTAGTWHEYGFDASKSSEIYGASETVQPNAVCLYYIMKVSE